MISRRNNRAVFMVSSGHL